MMKWKELSRIERYSRVLETYTFLKSLDGAASPSSKMITGIIRSSNSDFAIGGVAKLIKIIRVMDESELVDVTNLIDKSITTTRSIVTAHAPSAEFAHNGELVQPVIFMAMGYPLSMIAVGTPVVTARRAYRRYFMAAMRRQRQEAR